MRRLAAVLLLASVTGACSQPAAQSTAAQNTAAPAPASGCPTGTAPAVRFELHLIGSVNATDFAQFLDTEVTPRFQRGVTVLDAHLQSQEANGGVNKEDGHLLIVVVPPSITASAYISAIATAYDEKFDQDTALLSQANVCGGYIGQALPD